MKMTINFLNEAEYLRDFFEDEEVIRCLTSRYIFDYDDTTSILDLIYFIIHESKFYGDDFSESQLDDFYERVKYRDCESWVIFPSKECNLKYLVESMELNNSLDIIFEIPLAGGLGIAKKDDLHFVIYTDERNHNLDPHVHVYKGVGYGKGIRISLKTLKHETKSRTDLNKRDIKKAIKCIKLDLDFFFRKYDEIARRGMVDKSSKKEEINIECK